MRLPVAWQSRTCIHLQASTPFWKADNSQCLLMQACERPKQQQMYKSQDACHSCSAQQGKTSNDHSAHRWWQTVVLPARMACSAHASLRERCWRWCPMQGPGTHHRSHAECHGQHPVWVYLQDATEQQQHHFDYTACHAGSCCSPKGSSCKQDLTERPQLLC